jgi:hypothetical protein
MRWDTKPDKRIRRTFLRHEPTRRTSFYADAGFPPKPVGACSADEGVTVRAIAEHLKLDKSNASRRLRVAADDGYVRNLEDKRGKPGRWVLGDPLPETLDLLPDPAQLATVDDIPDLRGCAVAQVSDEKSEPTHGSRWPGGSEGEAANT